MDFHTSLLWLKSEWYRGIQWNSLWFCRSVQMQIIYSPHCSQDTGPIPDFQEIPSCFFVVSVSAQLPALQSLICVHSLFFLGSHIIEVMLAFWVWFLSLIIIRFILVANIGTLLLFCGWAVFHCLDDYWFIPQLKGCVHFLAVRNAAVTSTNGKVFLWMCFHFSWLNF
jgi:hypothetical protein